MNDWLDLMLAEIARKQREAEEAKKELARRAKDEEKSRSDRNDQSK